MKHKTKLSTEIRGYIYACIALLLLTSSFILLSQFYDKFENNLYDLRMQLSPRPEAMPEIIHLDIDDMSTQEQRNIDLQGKMIHEAVASAPL